MFSQIFKLLEDKKISILFDVQIIVEDSLKDYVKIAFNFFKVDYIEGIM